MTTTKHLPARLVIRAAGNEPECIITTPATDYMRDTIDPMGMETTGYTRGTCAVNFAHDHSRLPVGKTVSLAKSPEGIRAKFRWLESNPSAAAVRAAFAEGVLGASVEFVPVESEPNPHGGYHYAKSILTGWALTANPANPQCVPLFKSLGLGRAGADEIDIEGISTEGVALGGLTRVDVARVMRAEIQRMVESATRAALTRALPARAELDIEGIPTRGDVLAGWSKADVERAMREAIPALVGPAVTRALRLARGRLD